MSLLKNPNASPSHSAHDSQSGFSKIIVSVSLIMSLPCLNPFMIHCPNAPSEESVTGSPSTLPTPVPHPTLHSCQTVYGCPNTSCSLSPDLGHMLFPLSGMFTSIFYLANTKFSLRLHSRHDCLQKATLDCVLSDHPALRPVAALIPLYYDCLLLVCFSH